jgi:hypothetical protein
MSLLFFTEECSLITLTTQVCSYCTIKVGFIGSAQNFLLSGVMFLSYVLIISYFFSSFNRPCKNVTPHQCCD